MSGTGAITQLIALGQQDVHITGSPEISFFVSRLKSHANFSIFQQQQTIQSNPSAGGTSTVTFRRSGDLLNYVFMTVIDNETSKLVSDWSDIISKCELLIGDQVIDTQHVEFTEEIAPDLLSSSYAKSYQAGHHGGSGSSSYFYPFRFFHCESWTSSLPIISLQYSDVRYRITWSDSLNASYQIKIFATYAALDDIERKKFALNKFEMPIFQVQRQEPSHELVQNLYFNHPIKFIASSNVSGESNLVSITNQVHLEVNGTDITEKVKGVPFFTSVPSYYHTEYSDSTAENLFFYPFCINASKNQLTGSLNFSRLDSFRIHCTERINKAVYGVNWNFLRIENGIGGLLYAD